MIVPRHKKHPPAGDKASVRSSALWIDAADAAAAAEGEEVTLMDWGNAVFKKIVKGADGAVTGIEARATTCATTRHVLRATGGGAGGGCATVCRFGTQHYAPCFLHSSLPLVPLLRCSYSFPPRWRVAQAELHLAGDVKKTKLKLTWLADVRTPAHADPRSCGHADADTRMRIGSALRGISGLSCTDTDAALRKRCPGPHAVSAFCRLTLSPIRVSARMSVPLSACPRVRRCRTWSPWSWRSTTTSSQSARWRRGTSAHLHALTCTYMHSMLLYKHATRTCMQGALRAGLDMREVCMRRMQRV